MAGTESMEEDRLNETEEITEQESDKEISVTEDVENEQTAFVPAGTEQMTAETDENNTETNGVHETELVQIEFSEKSVEEQEHTDVRMDDEAGDADKEQTGGRGARVTENGHTAASDKIVQIPLSRVKTIMKMDPEVTLASQEAVVTIAKAAELFIMKVSQDSIYKTLQSKRKTLVRKDLDHALDTKDCYAFLEGCMEL